MATVREPRPGLGPEERPSHPAPSHVRRSAQDRAPAHGGGAAGHPARGAERAPLPVDAVVLPAPGAAYDAALGRALTELDLDLTPGMRAAIEAQVRLLLAWSPVVNLTAIREPEAIALEHVADSLAAVPVLLDHLASRDRRRGPVGILDLGSGAGYPGLPVAFALPAGVAQLVDSVGKKAAFLQAAGDAAMAAMMACGEEPPRIRAVTGRAEELLGEPGQRNRWDVVTARAVSPLPRLVELAVPFVRPGGVFVAWKRDAGDGALAAEIEAARPLLPMAGAHPELEIVRVALSGLEDHRLLLVTKRRSTPTGWPRRAGARRPLLP